MTTPTTLLGLLLLLLFSPLTSAQTYPYSNTREHDHHHVHGFKPSTVIMVLIVVGFLFCIGSYCIYLRNRTQIRVTQGLHPNAVGSFVRMAQPQGIDPEVINTFPTFQYCTVKGHKIGQRALECAVCLNEFEDDETLRLLPKCNHVFHSGCIDSWLAFHATCPVCRADLVPKPGETLPNPVFELEDVEAGEARSPNMNEVDSSRVISRTGSPISWSTAFRFAGIMPRSHSTGHSLVQQGGDFERFTLRLPEVVRSELLNTTLLKRTKSCQFEFPRVKSPRSGFKSEGSGTRGKFSYFYERFNRDGRVDRDRWGFSVTPPFVRKISSARLQSGGGGERVPSSSRSLIKSATMPKCFAPARENVGEVSFDRLRVSNEV